MLIAAIDNMSNVAIKIPAALVELTLIPCILFAECNKDVVLSLYLLVPKKGYYKL